MFGFCRIKAFKVVTAVVNMVRAGGLRFGHCYVHLDVFSKQCLVQIQIKLHLNVPREHRCTPNNVCTECTDIFKQCVQAKVALSSLDADSGNWSAPTISYCPGRLFFHLDLLYFVCWVICMEMDQFRKCVQLGTSLEQIFLPNNFSL